MVIRKTDIPIWKVSDEHSLVSDVMQLNLVNSRGVGTLACACSVYLITLNLSYTIYTLHHGLYTSAVAGYISTRTLS